ncbi:MAG: hypothetical protein HGB35_05370, partial [Geobacteraceae bacterium]|nr:hypothetical protein [Geobacteraceae bacterium]
AAFTWEINRYREVNNLLDYGMKYRTWDFLLPFYSGFNNAFFLKDYKTAATYMQRAAELSGKPLFANLAARFFYESGQTDLGILYLESMEASAKNREIKESFTIRKKALLAVKTIQQATEVFRRQNGTLPQSIEELRVKGFLTKIPADPYGGTFFLTSTGAVESTSKFAFRSGKQ